jgi:hypothetical protein
MSKEMHMMNMTSSSCELGKCGQISHAPVGHEAKLLIAGEILEKRTHGCEEVIHSDACQHQILRAGPLDGRKANDEK